MKQQDNETFKDPQQLDLAQYIENLIKSTPRCLTCGQKVPIFYEKPYCSDSCDDSSED